LTLKNDTYRAKTKGKVERFTRYLRYSFYNPLVTRLKTSGLVLDSDTANAEVLKWLRDTANLHIHGTTEEVPAQRLKLERNHLQPLPMDYTGSQSAAVTAPKTRKEKITRFSNIPLQHQRIEELCRNLNLVQTAESYLDIAKSCGKEDSNYTDFLESVLKTELTARQNRSKSILTRMAGFPAIKTLAEFDYNFATGVKCQVFEGLRSLSFMER
jgi:hypothetical protein